MQVNSLYNWFFIDITILAGQTLNLTAVSASFAAENVVDWAVQKTAQNYFTEGATAEIVGFPSNALIVTVPIPVLTDTVVRVFFTPITAWASSFPVI